MSKQPPKPMKFFKLDPLPRRIRRQGLKQAIHLGHEPYMAGLTTGQNLGYRQGVQDARNAIVTAAFDLTYLPALPESGKNDTLENQQVTDTQTEIQGVKGGSSDEVSDIPITGNNPESIPTGSSQGSECVA